MAAICAAPVIPGGSRQRRSNAGASHPTRRTSAAVRARGPTSAMSPRSTFTSCGSSSIPSCRSTPPDGRDAAIGHRPQLDDPEGPPPAPEPLLSEQHRRAVGDAHEQRRAGEDGTGDRQDRRRAQPVEQAGGHDRTGLR
jgi:hypothetical protein